METETTYLKVLSAEQKKSVEQMREELVALAQQLQAFRLQDGDNRGLVEEAASFAKMAADNLEELVLRAQPSRRRFGRS